MFDRLSNLKVGFFLRIIGGGMCGVDSTWVVCSNVGAGVWGGAGHFLLAALVWLVSLENLVLCIVTSFALMYLMPKLKPVECQV